MEKTNLGILKLDFVWACRTIPFSSTDLKNSRDQVNKQKEEPSKLKTKKQKTKKNPLVSQLQVNNISKLIITVDFLIITSNVERGGVWVKLFIYYKHYMCPIVKRPFIAFSYSSVGKESLQIPMKMLKWMQWYGYRSNSLMVFFHITIRGSWRIKTRESRANATPRQDSRLWYIYFSTFGHIYQLPHMYSRYL